MARTAVLLLPLAFAACARVSPLGPDNEGRATEDGVVLTVAVEPQTVAAGDTAQIQASLRNTNPHSMTLTFAWGCRILYYVENARGEVVAPQGGAWMCPIGATTLTIGPAETVTQTFRWTADGAPSRLNDSSVDRLPPGSYRLYATLDSDRVRLRTETVAITIR